MFLKIIGSSIVEDSTGSYQVGSNIELPLLLERFEIAPNGIDIIINPKYDGLTNDEMITMFNQVELDKIELAEIGQLESSLVLRLASVFSECCKIIIGKRHLSNRAYDSIQRAYLIKYENAIAGINMPIQALKFGLSVTAFNDLIIAKNDLFRANEALLFDTLEEKRFTLSGLIYTDRNAFTVELDKLILFPDEFENIIAI